MVCRCGVVIVDYNGRVVLVVVVVVTVAVV